MGLLTEPYLRFALVAGVSVAVMSGVLGYFVVLRSQVFSVDALSHVAFTGALGALAVGINPRLGLFAATIGVGVLLGLLGPRGRADDVVIGTVFAWVLGLGVLALSVYTTTRSAAGAGSGAAVLFGSILGLDARTTVLTVVVAVAVTAATLVAGRPLVFASLDPAVAAARGVPVRVLGVGLMALLGAGAAEATQVVGALLLLGLVAAPAGAAHRMTDRPFVALALSATIAAGSMLAGLTVSYLVPTVPPSSAVIVVAAVVHLSTYLGVGRPGSGRRTLHRRTMHRPT
jgi:zinc/manganese transport system permease protein